MYRIFRINQGDSQGNLERHLDWSPTLESSLTLIQCHEQDIITVQASITCTVQDFPCKYLGLPLAVKKLTKADFYGIIDKIADKLPGWKAAMMNSAGRATLVRAVLTAIPIYQLIALDFPKWAIKAIDKISRVFLWKCRKQVNGGHYLVSWGRVNRPIDCWICNLLVPHPFLYRSTSAVTAPSPFSSIGH